MTEDDPTGAAFLELGQKHIEYLLDRLEGRKCPLCGIIITRDIEEQQKAAGIWLDRCLDKACPPFETWPEVKDGNLD